jgi:hypothetical protein
MGVAWAPAALGAGSALPGDPPPADHSLLYGHCIGVQPWPEILQFRVPRDQAVPVLLDILGGQHGLD